MKKSLPIITRAFQVGTLGLCIIGMFMFTLLLCLQTPPPAHYYFGSADNDTVFSPGGFEDDIAALRCNTRKTKISRTNNFSTATIPAASRSDDSLLCFKFVSNLYNSQATPLQLNPNRDIIIHTTPPRAGPAFSLYELTGTRFTNILTTGVF